MTATKPAPSPKRECHKCSLNGKGDDYCWKTCLGPAENSGKGISKVTLGGMPAEEEYLYNHATPEFSERSEAAVPFHLPPTPERESGVTKSLNFDVERSLVRVLATFMSLSDVELCIFRHVYNGENIPQTARTLPKPMSKQAVSKHLYAMRDSDPIIGKVLSQLVRFSEKPSRNGDATADAEESCEPVQLDLFDLFKKQSVDPSGSVCHSVTHTREPYCTPTRRRLSRHKS